MQVVIRSLLLVVALVSCGGDDSRYKNTEMLERPPVLPIERHAGQEIEVDDSVIPKKKHKKGLGDDVYWVAEKPPQLKLKDAFDSAWLAVGLALKQREIKITDQVRDKGLYFVSYNPGTLFGTVSSLVSANEKEVIYMLAVEQDGAETKVIAKKANPVEQSSALEKDGYDDEASDDAEDLLQNLFETLRDDLIEE